MADLITNDAEVGEKKVDNAGYERVSLSDAVESDDRQGEAHTSVAQNESSSSDICVDPKASSVNEYLTSMSDQGSSQKCERVASESDCALELDRPEEGDCRTVDSHYPGDQTPSGDEKNTQSYLPNEKQGNVSFQNQQSDGQMKGRYDQSGNLLPPEQRLDGHLSETEAETGPTYNAVHEDVPRPISSLVTPPVCEPAQQQSKVLSEPEPKAENVLIFQYSSTGKTSCTSSCSRPADLSSVPDVNQEVMSSSITGVIPAGVVLRHRSNKGSWRASDKGRVFVAHGSSGVQSSANARVSAGSKPVAGRRAVNTKTWQALKLYDVIGNLSATSDLDRQSRGDIDVLYSALTLAADAGVKVAENVLGGERADRLDDLIARWTRKSHSVYCRLVQTSVYTTLSQKVTCFWRQTSVGRFFTFVSGWQADKADSLYRKVARIYQDGGFKESFSSVSGKTELWRVPKIISFPIIVVAYCVANILLLCHVVCLFLSGRTRANRGHGEVTAQTSPPRPKKLLLSKLPPKQKPTEGKELRGSVKEHKKHPTKSDDAEVSYEIFSKDQQSEDLAASLWAGASPPGKETEAYDNGDRNGSEENDSRNENGRAATADNTADGSGRISRDCSFEGGATASRTPSFFDCEDLDSSIDIDDSSAELSRARKKLTPVRRMTAFLKKHGYQFKTRLVSSSLAPTIVPYESLTLGQRLVCLLRKVPALAELLRDPRDPPSVMFLFGSCSCVDNEKIRQLLQMAPQTANRPTLKRKLDNVYPPESDTCPELSKTDDEGDDGPDDEELVTRDGTCQNRGQEDEADVLQENQTDGKF